LPGFVVGIVKKLFGSIKAFLSLISESITSLIEKIQECFTRLIIKMVLPDKWMSQMKEPDFAKKIVATVLNMSIVAMVVGGIVGIGLAKLCINGIIYGYSKFVGEGDDFNVISVIFAMCTTLYGLKYSDAESIRKRCLQMTALYAGGTVAAKTANVLFLLLPDVMRQSLMYSFAPKSVVQKFEMNNWKTEAMTLLSAGRTQVVIGSKVFSDRVKECMKKGQEVFKEMVDPTARNLCVGVYSRLLHLTTTLNQKQYSQGSRKLPFSIHVMAPPGVGKSLIMSLFIRKVFEYEENEVYQKDVSDEYWSGFLDQQVVLMDEFMIGDTASKSLLAKTYLSLVSTGQFMPPMASTDSPSVGIKGTTVAPVAVITMNNTPYDRPPHVNVIAFQGRRKFVIECRVVKGAKMLDLRNVDLKQYSRDQKRAVAWAQFRVIPGINAPESSSIVSPWMTFEVLCQFVKNAYNDHKILCDEIGEAFGGGMGEEKNPEDVINEILKDTYGIPKKPVSVMEAVLSLFTKNVAEGGSVNSDEFGPGEKNVQSGKEIEETERIITPNEKDEPLKMIINGSNLLDKKKFESLNEESEYNIKRERYHVLMEESLNLGSVPTEEFYSLKRYFDIEFEEEPIELSEAKFMSTKWTYGGKDRHAHACCGVLKHHKNGKSKTFTCKKCGKIVTCPVGESSTVEDYPVLSPGYHRLRKNGRFMGAQKHYHKCMIPDCPVFVEDEHEEEVHDPIFCARHGFESLIQNDVLADCYHVSVDMTTMHRHLCHFEDCQEVIAHRHVDQHGPVFCKKHINTIDVDILDKFDDMVDDYEDEDSPPIKTMKGLHDYLMSRAGRQMENVWHAYTGALIEAGKMHEEERRSVMGTIWRSGREMATIFFVINVLIGLYKTIKGKKVEENVTFCAQSPPPMRETRAAARRAPVKFTRGIKFQAQGATSDITTLYIGSQALNVIPLKDRWVMTYLHAMDTSLGPYADRTPMTLEFKGLKYVAELNLQRVVTASNIDVIFIYIENKTLPMFKDITSSFMSRAEISALTRLPVVMKTKDGTKYSNAIIKYNISYRCGKKLVELEECWAYKMLTVGGDCGSALTVSSGPHVGKIVGMHVAGTTNKTSDPQGISTIILKEEIMEATNDQSIEDFEIADDFAGEGLDMEEKFRPNCTNMEFVKDNEIVRITRKTKLRPSLLSGLLSEKPKKHRPILSSADPRSDGRDPIIESIEDTLSTNHPELNNEDTLLVRGIYVQIYQNMLAKLKWPVGQRRLTFLEACKGIPGKLSSLRTLTSPGYPLVHTRDKPGKKSFIWFDECGDFHYDPQFEKMVEDKLKEMRHYERKDGRPNVDHIFLGYMKDELVSDSKIKECRIRMIYANNLISLVAFRMIFGCVLAAIQESRNDTPSAIGMNQYSHDMDVMHNYLCEVGTNFVAGDYKSFDKRQHPTFRDMSYEILIALAGAANITAEEGLYIYDHETQSPAQIMDVRFWTISNHMSGCFFTTILNNLVNEGYMRFTFHKLNPGKCYDECARAKYLGDDHVIAVKKGVVMQPTEIAKIMKTLGQEYTSANKGAPLEDHYIKFEEVTFLGAHPRVLNGHWTGAMKKDTLYETIQWTRDKNVSLPDVIVQMVECASQWDKEFFEFYVADIKEALKSLGMEDLVTEWPCYEMISMVVADRGASSGYSYVGWTSEGSFNMNEQMTNDFMALDLTEQPVTVKRVLKPELHSTETRFGTLYEDIEEVGEIIDARSREARKKLELSEILHKEKKPRATFAMQISAIMSYLSLYGFEQDREYVGEGPPEKGKPTQGLTTITAGAVSVATPSLTNMSRLADHAINEKEMNMTYGTDSFMDRLKVDWTESMPRGHNIFTVEVPFGMLDPAFGGANPDNVQNMAFQRFIYYTGGCEIAIQVNGMPFQAGIAFLYWYPLTTSTHDLPNWIDVISNDGLFISPCDNTTGTLMIDFKYYRSAMNTYAGGFGTESLGTLGLMVLSPLNQVAGDGDCTVTIMSRFPEAKFTIPRPILHAARDLVGRAPIFAPYVDQEGEVGPFVYQAEGANYSTTSNSYEYNVSGVAGDMPIQNVAGTNTDQSAEGKLDLPMPMDNPPLVGGSIPFHQAFSSMSKSNGVEPTVALQLHPQQMNREHLSVFPVGESNVQSLVSRPGYSRVFEWSGNNGPGDVLLTFPLNSLLWTPPLAGEEDSYLMLPFNVGLLNQFMFWRSDIEITLRVAKTGFHSGRLALTTAYGAPGMNQDERNLFNNVKLDFTPTQSVASTIIEYNAATEFLRTWQGAGAFDQVQNYSLGTAMISVQNVLKVGEVASPKIEVLMSVRFLNTRVYEASPLPTCTFCEHYGIFPLGISITGITQNSPVQPEPTVLTDGRGRAVAASPMVKRRSTIEYVAEGPPEEGSVVVIEETHTDDIEVESMEMTASESVLVVDKPCRLDIGRKFEYCITDLHELLRRHVRVDPALITRSGKVAYDGSSVFFSFKVHLQSMFRHFMRGWAGHLKYRVFMYGDLSRGASITFVASGDTPVENDEINVMTDVQAAWNPTTERIRNAQPSKNYTAVEKFYPISDSMGFIDISIPFNTIFNFLPSGSTIDDGISPSLGTVVVTSFDAAAAIEVYQAIGDDFRLGIFRTPPMTIYSPYTIRNGGTAPPRGYALNGFVPH